MILVVSYGTTRLLSNSPHSGSLTIVAKTTRLISADYDTSQLYHGFLMGMVLYHPRVNDVLPQASPLEGHH